MKVYAFTDSVAAQCTCRAFCVFGSTDVKHVLVNEDSIPEMTVY